MCKTYEFLWSITNKCPVLYQRAKLNAVKVAVIVMDKNIKLSELAYHRRFTGALHCQSWFILTVYLVLLTFHLPVVTMQSDIVLIKNIMMMAAVVVMAIDDEDSDVNESEEST